MLYTRVGICLFLLLGPVAIPAVAKIVFHAKRDGQSHIYVINDDGSGERRLTFTPARDFNPRWSPDGKHIAFRREIPGEIIKIPGEQIQTYTYDVFLMDADGSNQRNLTNHPSINAMGSWSPDGRHIAFTSSRSGRLNIHLITVESGGHRTTDAQRWGDDTPLLTQRQRDYLCTARREFLGQHFSHDRRWHAAAATPATETRTRDTRLSALLTRRQPHSLC